MNSSRGMAGVLLSVSGGASGGMRVGVAGMRGGSRRSWRDAAQRGLALAHTAGGCSLLVSRGGEICHGGGELASGTESPGERGRSHARLRLRP